VLRERVAIADNPCSLEPGPTRISDDPTFTQHSSSLEVAEEADKEMPTRLINWRVRTAIRQ
jgi:hypothetical protein